MERKRVLILTTVLAPYRVDVFDELGKYCDLTVCFEQKVDDTRDQEWYKENSRNFKSIYLRGWEKPLNKIRFEIAKFVDKSKFDLAIAYEYSTPTAMFFMVLCKAKRLDYLINCDGGFINDHPIKGKIKRFFIKGASAHLSGSQHAYKYFVHYGASESKIFSHNFSSLQNDDILIDVVSKDEKKNIKKKLGLIPDKKYVLSIGRFVHLKGFDTLIKSWANVNPDHELIIIGGGELKNEYESLISELNLKNVTLKNFIKKEALDEYYKACDLFVLPTRDDVWGLVINEAMSKGMPVITTDKCVAGLELIEENENGFIVPVDNDEILTDKIEQIISNEKSQVSMGMKNIEKIKDYTVESIAKSHADVFESHF